MTLILFGDVEWGGDETSVHFGGAFGINEGPGRYEKVRLLASFSLLFSFAFWHRVAK